MERYNLLTPTGNPAHNQHVDLHPDHLLFRSYGRAVARRSYQFDEVELHPRWWDYSQTTTKYLCQFLSRDGDKVNLKILRKRIEDGTYLLVDLDMNEADATLAFIEQFRAIKEQHGHNND